MLGAARLLVALVASSMSAAMGWTIWMSFTNSRMLPSSVFVGLRQYSSLFANERWQVSVSNIAIFGVPVHPRAAWCSASCWRSLIDQRVRGENLLRSVFLYPFSMSFIVTGLVWQLAARSDLRHREAGARSRLRRRSTSTGSCGQERVIYTLVIAAVWHASGLVMAIMLAGLRGIDAEIWKATRVDGIPAWRVYVFDRPADAARQLRDRRRAARDQRGAALRSRRWR